MTLEAEPVSPGEALSGKLSGKLIYLLYQVGYMLTCSQLGEVDRLTKAQAVLETNNYVQCLTIDFSKAFDVVIHRFWYLLHQCIGLP